MLKFFLRDATLTLAAVVGIYLQPANTLSQALVGLLTGYIAYSFHEWSHFCGARLVNASIEPAQSLWSPFLFSFDSKSNSVQQFYAMTLPGFIATALYLLFFTVGLPKEPLWANIALLFGYTLAGLTALIEGPIALYAIVKKEIPVVEIPGFGNHSFSRKP